jgi:ATP-dependent Clp protease ATP-binding subunit ClpC
VFERFTDPAREVIAYGQEESRLLGHDHIGSEHLLLGLLRDGDDLTGEALQAVGVTLLGARARVEALHGRGKKPASGHIPFTPRAKKVLEQALRASQRLGQDHIGRPHLLRGLLEVSESNGVRLLVALGVDVDSFAATVDDLAVNSEPEAAASRPARSSAGMSFTRPQAGRPVAWLGSGRSKSTRDLAARVARVAAERDLLAQGLRRYGRHDDDCDGADDCTFGLAQLIETAADDTEPG